MNYLICGRMGEGKTTLAQYLAKLHSPGVVVWDPRRMIDGVVCHGPDELEDAIEEGRWREGALVYRFDSLDVGVEFSQFCHVLFPPGFGLGKFAVVIDEAAQLQTSNSIHPELSRMIRQHPRSVNVYQTTHSLQDWHRASRDLTNGVYCFAMLGRSLDAVVTFCDGDEEMRETIRTLQKHQCIHWRAESGTYEIWSDPTTWYIPAVRLNHEDVPQVEEKPASERRWIQ